MKAVRQLTRYKAWADDRFLAAVAAVPAAALTAPRPIYFGSLLRTLHHSFAMDHVWRCHLLGQPHGLESRNPAHCPGLDELAAAQCAMDQWYVAYAGALTARALDQRVVFGFIDGGRGAISRRDILLHVVNHGTYHRGHVADMLYTLGHFPPATDLPVFLREQATEAGHP